MKKIDFGDFEITAREIIASVVILVIMLLCGLSISNKMDEYRMDRNEVYNKSLKIEDAELFQYGLRTDVGLAFVYGELKAVDTVTYPEIGGEYIYVKKVTERYTRHTRRVAHTRKVGKTTQTYYTTEVYWTWDTIDTEKKHAEKISFNGVEFDYEKINIPGSHYIDTVKESSHIRYKFYGTDTVFQGTIYTSMKNGTISDGSDFYENMTAQETYEHFLAGDFRLFFWVVWIILTGLLIFGFYYIDNRWLY